MSIKARKRKKSIRIAVLGFGKEGRAVLSFLKKSPSYRRAAISIRDKKQGPAYLHDLASFDLVVKSPGVPFSLPEIQKVLKKGIAFTSATELFFQHAKGMVAGVTGTKGKGTTSTLLYKMLKASGRDAHLAGNIGKPALVILPKLKKNSITVLELSSFQLERCRYSPHVALVLEVTPDHLDAHPSFGAYARTKSCIVRSQKKNDAVLFFPGNRISKKIALLSPGKKIPVEAKKFSLFSPGELRMPGYHNFENAAMAASAALYLGAKPETVRRTALGFPGLAQRLSLVKKIRGLAFYNDSASTNPSSTAAAIRAFATPSILIAGGKDKGLRYDSLCPVLQSSSVRLVILYGENKDNIASDIKPSGVPLLCAGSLEGALETAKGFLRRHRIGDEEWTVIFSPASASFDMFKNAKERGKVFEKLVKNLRL